jgi:hypothetical protein
MEEAEEKVRIDGNSREDIDYFRFPIDGHENVSTVGNGSF